MGDSAQAVPTAAGRERRWFSVLPRWQGVVLLLLIVWLYASILARLVAQWIHDPNFSHGFFVPAFAVFVLWQNRHQLRSIDPSPSWLGLALIVCALLMLMLGVLGAELFFSRSSLLLLLAGLIILFQGWPFFRAVLFPWAFLILMIPIPVLVFQKVTFPLQILASKLASWFLPFAGVPVLREGNIIVLAAMPLEVAEACSGIRSLLSLVTLAIIYSYLMDNRKWMRVLLAFSAVPIAVAANGFRVVGTGLLVQYWDPEKAEGFLHIFSGWLIFVVSLALLFILHRVLSRVWRPSAEAEPMHPLSHVEASAKGNARIAASSLRFVFAAGLMLATAILLQARSSYEVVPHREPLSSLPLQLGEWTGRDVSIDQRTLDILGAGEFLLRDFESRNPDLPSIGLFIAYFPSQRMGDTIHSPDHCLPGAGWVPTERRVVQIARSDGSTFPANRYVVSRAGERQLVLYWYQAHDRVVAGEYWAKYYLIADAIRMNRSDGALIRLITPMYEGESPEAAQARLMSLGSQLVPLLNAYIPG